jgi:hypothetical protein
MMRKAVIAYIVLWTALCVLPAARRLPRGGARAAGQTTQDTAPDFIIHECVRADSIHLADYLDGPVLLVFYDGGLVTNINSLRYAKEWERRYAGDGLSIIGIHSPFFEPSKISHNAIEVVGITGAMTPIGLDMDREVYDLYGLTALPAFVLIQPGGNIAASISGEQVYAEVERAVQEELKRLNPDIVLPLIAKPMKPWDDPQADLFEPTPMLGLGYASGRTANADSSLVDVFGEYEDARDRTRDVVFLKGRWKVGEYSVAYSDSLGGLDSHIRVIYRGKSVWILPAFDMGQEPRVYVKQDRSYIEQPIWGKDIMGDQQGRPYIHMKYSIPCQIVENPTFGVHQLELIPGEGDVSFYYLFFEADVRN